MTITRDQVLAALSRIELPEGGSLVSRDLVRALTVNGGTVRFVIEATDPDAARALVEEKEHVRALEQDLQRSHLDRLKQGRVESIDTSNIHQETLRALKQVNTAFSMVAYPILSETGDLLASRLAKPHHG